MSFASYYMTYENGISYNFETRKLIELLKPITKEVKSDGLELFVDIHNSSFLLIDTSSELNNSFAILRPCGIEDEFIFQYSKDYFLVLTEPDLKDFIIFNVDTLNHLPLELKEGNSFHLCKNSEEFKDRFQRFPYQ